MVDVQSEVVDVPEIQGTIEEIAKEKCSHAAKAVSSETKDTAACEAQILTG